MVAAEGSELLRLPLRIFHVVVRESPSALACSSSAMRPARRSATSTSLSLIERLAFAAAMASPISLIFAVCPPRAGRREVRSGGRGPPFERRPGMQSSQHIQSALMLRLSLRPVGFVLPKLAALAAEFCPDRDLAHPVRFAMLMDARALPPAEPGATVLIRVE